MKFGIIGCGYVFDHYMATLPRHPGLTLAGVADIDTARLRQATDFYGLKAYDSVEALLADPDVPVVANFTSIEAHHAVTKAALEAGKHVYSEKPLVMRMEQAHELMALAAAKGLHLSCAPSNALGPTSQTMWKAVRDGAVGAVRLVYAEFDDNPIYLMSPETWRSRSGAPWPYLHEYEMGCTWEHVGYHLTWMCAIFGPVRAVTAFSKVTLPDKTGRPLHPADTPDFSVACLDFESGVAGRVTCSIAAPYDHRMRIIGNRGMVHADTYRHYECPVMIEPFTKLNLNARKARSVRTRSWLGWPFGVGGRSVPLVRTPPPGARAIVPGRALVASEGRPSAPPARRARPAGQDDRHRRTGGCGGDGPGALPGPRFHPAPDRADAGDPGRRAGRGDPPADDALRSGGPAGPDRRRRARLRGLCAAGLAGAAGRGVPRPDAPALTPCPVPAPRRPGPGAKSLGKAFGKSLREDFCRPAGAVAPGRTWHNSAYDRTHAGSPPAGASIETTVCRVPCRRPRLRSGPPSGPCPA